jgi:hypothetical membrane protein
MNRKIYLFGIAASLVYSSTVIAGGFLRPGYSQIRQAISELSMDGAPNKELILALFTLYNILLMIFSFSIYKQHQNKLLKASAALLFLVGLSGLMMNIFPQDPINSTATLFGILHFVFAGAAAIGTILAIFFGGVGFEMVSADKNFKLISLFLGFLVIVFGGMTPIAINTFASTFGVFERITIFSFILWLAIFSCKMFHAEEKRLQLKI